MSKSKNDVLLAMRMFQDFFSRLSSIEVENLLNGRATISYVEKKISNDLKKKFDNFLLILAKKDSREEMLNYLKNNDLLDNRFAYTELCNYLNIRVKSKENLSSLEEKILGYVEENKQSLVQDFGELLDVDNEIDYIASEIESFNNTEEALNYLRQNKVLQNRSNLRLLAKSLNVYLQKDLNNEAIMENIVESVVGAKLRSLAIRNSKSKKSIEE